MRILFGVTGGIAAYKAVGAVRQFALDGHDVHVVPTERALRFVGRPTWEAISHNPVSTDIFDHVDQVEHVAQGTEADLVVVAPATADFIARAAGGHADDLLTASLLATTAPVVIAPAMHTAMWRNPAVQRNVALLREDGITIAGPEFGRLTGVDQGMGRMAEPEDIVEAAYAAVTPKDLAGRTVVISAGGTRERVDPVRFLGNDSSGKQGVALAREAQARGAQVILVTGHLDVAPPRDVEVIKARYTESMRQAIHSLADEADVIIMAAAIADYRPIEPSRVKVKKEEAGREVTMQLVANPDILAEISHQPRRENLIIGFAAETASGDELLELGRAKIERKGCDLLVLNEVGESKTFGFDDNSIAIIDQSGEVLAEASGSKREVAAAVIDQIVMRLQGA